MQNLYLWKKMKKYFVFEKNIPYLLNNLSIIEDRNDKKYLTNQISYFKKNENITEMQPFTKM